MERYAPHRDSVQALYALRASFTVTECHIVTFLHEKQPYVLTSVESTTLQTLAARYLPSLDSSCTASDREHNPDGH